jgi:hypothetical protein
MNTTTTIVSFFTTNSPLLNLSATQTAIVLFLTGVGAFYTGKLTARLTKWALAL